MTSANPLVRGVKALLAIGGRWLTFYRWMDAQIWDIAKTEGPGAPKSANREPRVRCC